jgi:photosystem II stability/assembly factor-like uncharacterized protein
MRKILFALFLLVPTFSQAQNWQSLDGPYGQIVTGITQEGNTSILASSYFEGIFKSSTIDGWKKVLSDSQHPGWSFVEAIAEDILLAGQPSSIVKSTDGGMNWEVSITGVDPADLSYPMCCRIGDSVFTIFRSTEGRHLRLSGDQGNQWQFRLSYPNTAAYALSADSMGRMIMGGYEVLHYSDDHFFTLNAPQLQQPWRVVTGLATDSTGRLWLAATDEGIRISRDRLSWTHADESLPDTIWTVAVTPRGIAYMGSAEGVHTSTDGGETWTSYNKGFPSGFVASYLYVAPDGHLYVGTNGAGIFKTEKPVTGAYAVLPPQQSVDREKSASGVTFGQDRITILAEPNAELSFVDVLGRTLDIPVDRSELGFSVRRNALPCQLVFVLLQSPSKLTQSIKLVRN